MTPSYKSVKRYTLRDETLVKLFLMVSWPPMAVFLLLSFAFVTLAIFFSIPFCRVYDKDGKISIDLPGMKKIRR
jgi:hypothetical protein